MFAQKTTLSVKSVSLFRYSIDKRSDATKTFKIDPDNGTLTVARVLDRETASWHSLTVEATERSKENSVSFTSASPIIWQLAPHFSYSAEKTCVENTFIYYLFCFPPHVHHAIVRVLRSHTYYILTIKNLQKKLKFSLSKMRISNIYILTSFWHIKKLLLSYCHIK